jgi:type I restriction enzyme S subunit
MPPLIEEGLWRAQVKAVVDEVYDGANCIDLIISRPGSGLKGDFLATWINSDFGMGAVFRAQGGLAQQHFNVGDLSRLEIVLPTINEQDRILNRLAIQKNLVWQEEQSLAKLALLKQALMQDLLTGRVRVKASKEKAAC